jgi:hypothetical protein
MMTEAMTRTLHEPPTSARIPRRRLPAAVLTVGLLAVVVGLFLVQRSITGDLLTATSGNRISAFPGERVDEPFGERDAVEVAYRHGETYTFEVTINNPTRWNVRVSDFPLTPDLGMLQPVDFAIDTTPFDAPDRTFTPFRPFTIRAGEAAMVRVRTRFANCDRFDPGHSSTLVALPVRYRALWATQTSNIELPTFVRVDSPEDCPTR